MGLCDQLIEKKSCFNDGMSRYRSVRKKLGSAFLCLRLTGIYGLLPLLLLISRICRDARFATRSEPVHESEAGKKSPRSKMHFASVRGDSGNLFVPYFHAIKSEAFSAADRAEIRQSDCLSSSI